MFKLEDLKMRVWISSVIVLTIGGLLYLSDQLVFGITLAAIFSVLVLLAQWEFYHMAAQKGLHEQSISYLAAPLYIGAIFISSLYPSLYYVPSIVLGVLIFLFLMQHFFFSKEPISRTSVTLMGLFYVVVPLGFLIKTTFAPTQVALSGRWWVMLLVVVTKGSDVGAYFIGKSIGRHYLAPKISPKKTYEGLLGGIFFSVGTAFAVIYLTPGAKEILHHPWLYAVLLGVGLSIIGLIGDLAESILKRDAGVKDSNKFKGFGGFLDLFDSLIFTGPAFYLFLICDKIV